MTGRAIVYIARENGERSYRVYVGGDCAIDGVDYDRSFIWGHFDEGDITWRQAMKMAAQHADNVAKKIGGEVVALNM